MTAQINSFRNQQTSLVIKGARESFNPVFIKAIVASISALGGAVAWVVTWYHDRLIKPIVYEINTIVNETVEAIKTVIKTTFETIKTMAKITIAVVVGFVKLVVASALTWAVVNFIVNTCFPWYDKRWLDADYWYQWENRWERLRTKLWRLFDFFTIFGGVTLCLYTWYIYLFPVFESTFHALKEVALKLWKMWKALCAWWNGSGR